jgi:hypothetical protein
MFAWRHSTLDALDRVLEAPGGHVKPHQGGSTVSRVDTMMSGGVHERHTKCAKASGVIEVLSNALLCRDEVLECDLSLLSCAIALSRMIEHTCFQLETIISLA